MDVRMVAAVSGAGGSLNVSAFCRERGITTQTFYKWRKRFASEGLDGLAERSRAPHRSPARTTAEVEEAIISLRKELAAKGADAGAGTIQWHLGRRGQQPVPSEATIWRVLVRRGFVVPQPHKRPKTALRRFEAPAPNVLWQIDATAWAVDDHARHIEIINLIDDHSRLAVACLAVEVATCDAAWTAFSAGVAARGLPSGLLSDNGLAFSGRLRGFEVAFEANLRAAGVRPITSRPFHPQTCGKVERFQQTLKRWLAARRRAAGLEELQGQLDAFVAYYNHERPHRGIGRITPAERWAATPPAINLGVALPWPGRETSAAVDTGGRLQVRPWTIHIGVGHAGQSARVLLDDTHAAVFIGGVLVRHLQLDHSRTYQGSGKRRGGPRQPRPT